MNHSTDSLPAQQELFSTPADAPLVLPTRRDLYSQPNLKSVFEACHDHIYANEGLLKEKIFNEVVKLILMKLVDEGGEYDSQVRFGITSEECARVLSGEQSGFEKRIHGLFEETKRQYGRFFESDNGLLLSSESLAFTVAQLQLISLKLTPRDVKGEAFQAIVYRHARGDRGEFFTPNPVVRLTVGILDPQAGEFVIDPAAGSGGFLIETIRNIGNDHSTDRSPERASENIRRHVRGIEFNPDIARSAMIRLAFEGGSGDEVECRNALKNLTDHLGSYDVLITNPPFGTKGRIREKSVLTAYDLARKWKRASAGRFQQTRALLTGQTPEVLFLERCIKLLKPGGRMAIVLPDGLLHNSSSAHIRQWLMEQADVFAVISLPQETFIPYGTGIKTSVIFARRRNGDSPRRSVFMAKIRRIGYDVKGQIVFKRDTSGTPIIDASGERVIDDEIEEVVEAFRAYKGGTDPGQADDRFVLGSKVLNGRFDVEHYLPSDLELIDRLSQSHTTRLGQLADIVTRRVRLQGDREYRYIAISDIDARSMRVVNQQIVRGADAPSRASFKVHAGDILTAVSGASTGTEKHASAIVTQEEDGAICSNGLAVLRNVRDIDLFYLLSYLRTPAFLRQVKRQLTGHAIPAISKEDLGNVLVAIPGPTIMDRISAKLREAQELRKEAQKVSSDAIDLASLMATGADVRIPSEV